MGCGLRTVVGFSLGGREHRIMKTVVILFLLVKKVSIFGCASFGSNFRVISSLKKGVFPSTVLSMTAASTRMVAPSSSVCLKGPGSYVTIQIGSEATCDHIHVRITRAPFFSHSISRFILGGPQARCAVCPSVV